MNKPEWKIVPKCPFCEKKLDNTDLTGIEKPNLQQIHFVRCPECDQIYQVATRTMYITGTDGLGDYLHLSTETPSVIHRFNEIRKLAIGVYREEGYSDAEIAYYLSITPPEVTRIRNRIR
jgi:hypothetical protein